MNSLFIESSKSFIKPMLFSNALVGVDSSDAQNIAKFSISQGQRMVGIQITPPSIALSYITKFESKLPAG